MRVICRNIINDSDDNSSDVVIIISDGDSDSRTLIWKMSGL